MRVSKPLSILAAALAFAHVASAQEEGSLAVTESDYATYRKLEYARVLAEKRTTYDRGNKAKYAAEYQAALKASGWSEEKKSDVESALGEATTAVAMEKGEEEGVDPADMKEYLAGFNRTTLATVRAHYKELRGGGDDHERADAQVRREREEAAAGTPVTAALIEGTWVPDVDATLRALMGGMEIEGKARADLEKSMDGLSYRFGPGSAVVASSKDGSGKPRAEKGTYRIEGRKIFMKAEGSKREHDLDAGMHGPHLMLGRGFGKVLYRKK